MNNRDILKINLNNLPVFLPQMYKGIKLRKDDFLIYA